MSKETTKNLYAVSIVVRNEDKEKINIQTLLNLYEAYSEYEAVGNAVEKALQVFPDHSIFLIAKVQIAK